MIVLGIETSCDETAAAIVRDGRHVLSNAVNSQVDLHKPYGGVVPEIASRSHVEVLPAVLSAAIADAGITWSDIDCIAATYAPGLAPSLMAGLSAAKGIAFATGKPLRLINHIEAHIYSVFISANAPTPAAASPMLVLIVSGGHTLLARMHQLGHYTLLGQTVDDAAGEAFDKGANLLGLGYPGGPAIDRLARDGNPRFIRFPRGRQRSSKMLQTELDTNLCFSFSGLKTALLYHLRDNPITQQSPDFPSVVASYQEAIVDALVKRCFRALRDEKYLAVVGGVSLNKRLRQAMTDACKQAGVSLLLPEPRFCADNAAMVAGLAGAGRGITGEKTLHMDVIPSIESIPDFWAHQRQTTA